MTPESLLILALMAGLLFLMFSRTRRQQREAQQIQANLTVGAQVMTTAGLYATVVGLEEQMVTLETSPGQTSRWDRRAVARIISSGAPGATGAVRDGEDRDDDDRDEHGYDTTEGAGARLEHGTADGDAPGATRSPSSQDPAPPDRT